MERNICHFFTWIFLFVLWKNVADLFWQTLKDYKYFIFIADFERAFTLSTLNIVYLFTIRKVIYIDFFCTLVAHTSIIDNNIWMICKATFFFKSSQGFSTDAAYQLIFYLYYVPTDIWYIDRLVAELVSPLVRIQ